MAKKLDYEIKRVFTVLDCPFCGGLPEMCNTNQHAYWLRCEKCGADAPSKKTPIGGVGMWNNRHSGNCKRVATLILTYTNWRKLNGKAKKSRRNHNRNS